METEKQLFTATDAALAALPEFVGRRTGAAIRVDVDSCG